MKITATLREYRKKKGLWVSFNFKKDVFEVISENVFKQAIEYFQFRTEVNPELNDKDQIIGFKINKKE